MIIVTALFSTVFIVGLAFIINKLKQSINKLEINKDNQSSADIDFSDAFETSVEAKMTAEQAALKAEQDKKTALIKAEQEKEAALIKATQNKETAVIEAEAAIARANGEAESMRIIREALQDMPQTYIQQLYLETWNGELPDIMTSGDNSLLITPPTE